MLHRLPLLKRKLHIETIRCCLAEDLYDKLCKLFMTERVEFALFCGTPCVHQKLTIQISKGQKLILTLQDGSADVTVNDVHTKSEGA